MSGLHYTNTSIDDFENLNHLYQKHLNGGEYIRRWLKDGLSMPEYFGVKCMDGDKIVGAITIRPGVSFTYGHSELVDEILLQYTGKEISTVDMVAVAPDYRGNGVARFLCCGLHEELVRRDVKLLVLEAWYDLSACCSPPPIVGIFEKYIGDLEIYGDYPNFYENLHQFGISCSECGDKPCGCGAKIYIITVQQKRKEHI